MTTLLIATRNAHKVGEIRDLLGTCFSCLTLSDFPGAPKVPEDADTFAGNAIKKATELAIWLRENLPSGDLRHALPDFVMADDSGLEVDYLMGAPGVHSARFAALDRVTDSCLSAGETGNSPDMENNAKLLRLLRDATEEKRAARFCCLIALVAVRADRVENASPVGQVDKPIAHTFAGTCAGRIRWKASGTGGFGYDPLFAPEGYEQTFAELGGEVKNMISHRAKALDQVKRFLSQVN
jgi:XTP/dITP diphosphohydrolase